MDNFQEHPGYGETETERMSKGLVLNCPECGKEKTIIFVDKANFGGAEIYVPVHKCENCNFSWTDDIAGEIWDKNNKQIRELQSELKSEKLENQKLRAIIEGLQ